MSKMKITVAFLIFLTLIVSVEAYNRLIYSNPITDNVSDYVLGTLTASSTNGALYSNVTYSGTLTLNGAPAAGKQVYLFQNNTIYTTVAGTSWTQIAASVTDLLGEYAFTYNRTATGYFYRIVGFDAGA